ncbi:hypothetical protein [Clostridium sp.]|uniref:hypothetical protein n=1 Tax=Clostridium sp. TaxID=1506 RepID=UPI002618B51E|nr:hypothetical protein [Clostridium sp.]
MMNNQGKKAWSFLIIILHGHCKAMSTAIIHYSSLIIHLQSIDQSFAAIITLNMQR